MSTLSQYSIRGVSFLMLQSVFGKMLSLGAQVLLARLLLPEDWGLFALALAITSFASIVGQLGMTQVLVYHFDEHKNWAPTAQILTTTSGALATMLVFYSSATLSDLVQDDRFAKLLWFLSPEIFFSSAAVVSTAKLRGRFQFGALALIASFIGLTQTVGAVVFAYAGYGVESFVIMRPLLSFAQFVILQKLSGDFSIKSFEFHKAFYLLKHSTPILAASLCYAAIQEGDYLVLGLLSDPRSLGQYYLAFSLSAQITTLVTFNIQTVLMSALSSVKDSPDIQDNYTLRAIRLLALLVVPLSFALAFSAKVLITTLFGNQWELATQLLQLLSFVAIFRILVGPLAVLLQARGDFKIYARCHFYSATTFIISVVICTYIAGPIGTSVAVLFHSAVSVLIFFIHVQRNNRLYWRDLIAAISAPTLSIIVAVISVSLANTIVPSNGLSYALNISIFKFVTLAALGSFSYIIILYFLAFDDIIDFVALLRLALSRKSGKQIS